MPDIIETHHHEDDLVAYGWRLFSEQKLADAGELGRRLIHANPECADAWYLMALVHRNQGTMLKGIEYLKRAVLLQPGRVDYRNSLGVFFLELNDLEKAAISFRSVLDLSPDHQDALTNLGLVYYKRQKPEKALDCFRQVLSLNANHLNALANMAMVQAAIGQLESAAKDYASALAINPRQPKWLGNLGAIYLKLGRYDQAVQCFQNALEELPQYPPFAAGLGVALRAKDDWFYSIRVLEDALVQAFEDEPLMVELAVAYQHTCQWKKLEPLYLKIDNCTRMALKEGRQPVEQPLSIIRRSQDGVLHLKAAQAWSRTVESRSLASMLSHRADTIPNGNRAITVGYLSYDFRDHPVAHQLTPLFRLHDRNRFRVVAFSMGPDDGSAYRRSIQRHSDRFIDIGTLGVEASVDIIRDNQVDILVDLMGHTHHNRMEILALRPAPIQVSYLGYLASTGARFMDYLIADPVVVPPEHNGCYSEKLIRLPHCYQLNHYEDPVNIEIPERRDWGLPEHGFVYCCFNQSYKLDKILFQTWLRILMKVPHAVLWMARSNPMAEQALLEHAMQSGIDTERLIFADKVDLAIHLQRLQLADLALDTLAYNGGATTANALWAGVPVLTTLGGHWVSRMSASHLITAGLSRWIVSDLKAYEEAAVACARDREGHQKMRQVLKANLRSTPLFRSEIYMRHYEKGLEMIYERHRRHQPTAHIDIHDDSLDCQ